jgi:glutathione S-transferase
MQHSPANQENGGLLAIYEGQADASGFYERSKQVWSNLAQLIEQLETKFQRQTYLVGDQISLAE